MNIWLFENGCLIAKNTAGVEIYKLSYEHESGAVWASVFNAIPLFGDQLLLWLPTECGVGFRGVIDQD